MLSSTNQQQVISNLGQALRTLRDAMTQCQNLYEWFSANGVPGLESIGFSPSDAQALMNAITDANEIAKIYNGGDLGSYTLPYNFTNSISQVIGPVF